MSNNFKPLTDQVAEKLIQQFKDGNSVFQNNGDKPLMMPFNPATGKNYRGAAALILLMKNERDPRWMSLKNASFNNWPVKKDEKGTLISFYKTSELQPVTNDKGETKMEPVKLKDSELTTTFLFNGAQLKDMPALVMKPQEHSPGERLAQIMANSGMEVPANDVRQMAEQLVAQKPSESSVRDALQTNIAALFISAELNLPYELGDHVGYLASWSQLLKEQPAELFKAANDAQKITDKIIGFEKKRAVSNEATLNKGDVIAYKGDTITVLAILRGKTAQVENSAGMKFKVGPTDNLYTALVEARNNPQERPEERGLPAGVKEEQTYAMAR